MGVHSNYRWLLHNPAPYRPQESHAGYVDLFFQCGLEVRSNILKLLDDTTVTVIASHRLAGEDLNGASTTFWMATISDIRESVVINIPSANALTPPRRFKGKIEEFTNKQLILLADEQIDVAADITAQSKDHLFIGTVCKCAVQADARWAIHVGVKRTILVI